ncbi:MAG: PIN domain-containing protein [Anaerolineales bacterium]|nr:PIN domain-containing protein [Anaerolineales bacterium]
MSLEFFIRLIGMVVFGVLGGYFGVDLSKIEALGISIEEGAVIFGLVGSLFGLVLTPFLTTRPLKSLRVLLGKLETKTLGAGLLGLTVGLVIAALLAFPLSLLPSPFGEIIPFVGVMLFGYFGVAIFIMRRNDIFSLFGSRVFTAMENGDGGGAKRTILVDTSVIIDGRIADIAKTGFLAGELLIPRFVLDELQYIADSADGLRRQRGRRGMEILSELQELQVIPVRISDIDVEGTREVDSKLVILARQMNSPILTNDYNLNRIAELQGVPVLNINELANSVKAVLLPGEEVNVKIIQEGKERGQGVGYLSDGTMVVVEEGKDYLDETINAVVTKVLQTAAGRMIFAKPNGEKA